jgi:hypothetical protein
MLKKVALVVVALALVAVVPVTGQNPKFVSGDIMIGWVETTVPPDTKCLGGEPVTPAPPYYLPCSEDTTHVVGRDEVQIWYPAPGSAPARLDGPITFVVNCNMSADYRGPCFGTFVWDVPGIGRWEGSWTAPVMDLLTYESRMAMVGHGVSGEVEGLQLVFDGGSAPYDWYISGSFRIH